MNTNKGEFETHADGICCALDCGSFGFFSFFLNDICVGMNWNAILKQKSSIW